MVTRHDLLDFVAQLKANGPQNLAIAASVKLPAIPVQVLYRETNYVHRDVLNVLLSGRLPRAALRGRGLAPRDREFHSVGLSGVGIPIATERIFCVAKPDAQVFTGNKFSGKKPPLGQQLSGCDAP